MTTLTSLPPEILEYILGQLDFPDLCTHRRQFLGISFSPHLARHVRQLHWFSLYHANDPDDFSKSYFSQPFATGCISEFRAQFFEGLDSMPNLTTLITSILPRKNSDGPLWHETHVLLSESLERPRRYYGFIEGLTHFLGPAMCRPQSRIKVLRCQDEGLVLPGFPIKYRIKRPRQNLAGPLNINIDLLKLESTLTRQFCSLIPEFDHSVVKWQDAFASLTEIDLCTAFALADPEELQRQTLQPICWSFLRAAKNLQLFDLRWDNLQTLKLVNLTFSTKEFNVFLSSHASTLRHILLYHCQGSDAGFLGIVKFAAAEPFVHLHRFLVAIRPEQEFGLGLDPWDVRASDYQAQIIVEQEILDFVNSKDPAKDPFLSREPIGFDEWHIILQRPSNGIKVNYYANTWATAVQFPKELQHEWPRWNTLQYTCKPCGKK
ncbi:hypothetical protein NW762_009974 [Fusarium torreyae]|uniref:F-box domain-containing protein n=1 Tax=Fusarium torreyae TaxID=1237075 RepID=A0A9W8RSC2_9HYPO|nr:hypothetical protein NW762_009974 [Fusarium torreyae]